jgi:hypothetical protein
MRQGSRQTVYSDDHKRIALADSFQYAGQHRPCAIAARRLFFMDLGATRGFQGLLLGQGGLILGRYADVAGQGNGNRAFSVPSIAT